MRTIVVSGWNVGFQKVEFTKFLRSEFGYSLAEAKAATDAVLDNQEVALRIPDREVRRISARLGELGAMLHCSAENRRTV